MCKGPAGKEEASVVRAQEEGGAGEVEQSESWGGRDTPGALESSGKVLCKRSQHAWCLKDFSFS